MPFALDLAHRITALRYEDLEAMTSDTALRQGVLRVNA